MKYNTMAVYSYGDVAVISKQTILLQSMCEVHSQRVERGCMTNWPSPKLISKKRCIPEFTLHIWKCSGYMLIKK